MGIVVQIDPDSLCRRTCSFCSIRSSEPGHRNMTLEEFEANLRYFWERFEIQELILGGGEITDRPDLAEILEIVASYISPGRLTVVSRGARWLDPKIRPLVQSLNPRISYSFDAWTRADLDPDRPGSFLATARRTTAALTAAGVRVTSGTVLSSAFIDLLPAAGEGLASLAVSHSTITFPFPRGGILEGPREAVPSLEAARQALATLAAQMTAAGRPYTFKGLPTCYIPEHAPHINKTKNRPWVSATQQAAEAIWFIPGRLNFWKPPSCAACRAFDHCDGFWELYLQTGEFPPLKPLT